MFVAHGMAFLKPSVKWTDNDINDILFVGTGLFNTSNVNEKFNNSEVITKTFLLKNYRLRVSLSEPKVVGKILTMEKRSIGLYKGLKMFFAEYKCGVLKAPNLDLYIKRGKLFYIFDPRGRTSQCERNSFQGEAAVVALRDLENVYHLILNLSKVDTNAPFKISFIELAKAIENDFGDPVTIEDNTTERQSDYRMLNDDAAILTSNLSYNSKIFGDSVNKQHLATSIMAFVYSKIDPPNSWSRKEMDKIIRLGTDFYKDFRNRHDLSLKLTDIPSKFYVGENFKTEIVIIPNVISGKVFIKTHVYFDSNFCLALKEVFNLQKVTAFLVQVGEDTYGVWKTKDCEVYYLFDGYQKDVTGNFDSYSGSANVLMIATLDNLCRIFIERLLKLDGSVDAEFKIHGLMVINVERLPPRQPQKKLPRIKCLKDEKMDFARLEDFEKISEVSSIVQAVELSTITTKQKLMVDGRPAKPLYKKVTDLSSPSLVCEPPKEYDEIIRSWRKKRYELLSKNSIREKVSTLKDLVESVRSNLLQTMDFEPLLPEPEGISEKQPNNEDDLTELETKDKNTKTNIERMSTVLLETVIEKQELTPEKTDLKVEKSQPEKQEDGPSQFVNLPDESEIIHASKSILDLTSLSIHDIKNISLFTCISAIMTSAKYSIASWSPEVLDYVLTNAENLVKFVKLSNRMDLFTNAEMNLTKLKIQEKLYNLNLTAIDHDVWSNLLANVEKNFLKNDRFVISTLRGSVTVFKRSNLYYIFEGFPCNLFGYRSVAGFSSFMRVKDLRRLVQRIKKNHEDNNDNDNFIIHLVTFERISEETKPKNERLIKRGNLSVLEKDNTLIKITEKPKLGTDLLPDITNSKIVKNKDIIRGTFALDYRDEIQENIIKPCHFASVFAIMYSIHHPIEKQNYRSVDIILENGLKIFESLKTHRKQDYRLKNVIVDDINYEIQVLQQKSGTPVKGIHNRDEYFGLKETLKRSFFRQKYVMIQFPNCCYTLVKVDSNTYYIFDSYEAISYEQLYEEFSKKKELEKKSVNVSNDPEKEKNLNDDPDKKEEKKKNETTPEIVGKEFQRKFYVFLRSKMASNKIEGKAGWVRLNQLSKLIDYLQSTLNDPQFYTRFTIHNVYILSYDKVKDSNKHFGYLLLDGSHTENSLVRGNDCEIEDEKKLPSESIDWVTKTHIIPWLKVKNVSTSKNKLQSKWKDFDVEIKNSLYSLWSKDHPNMAKFGKSAGKQYSAVCVMSLLMAQIIPIDEWTSTTLDQIVDLGTKYYENSLTLMNDQIGELDIKHLAPTFTLQDFQFKIKIDSKLRGHFYDHRKERKNFSKALEYIFKSTELIGAILKKGDRIVTFGKSGQDYFMFDCQSYDPPLFAFGIGVAYLLRCCCLSTLLKCLILTIGAKTHNVSFEIFQVDISLCSEKHLKYLRQIESMKAVIEDKKRINDETRKEAKEKGAQEAKKEIERMIEEEKYKTKKEEEIKKLREEVKKRIVKEKIEKTEKEAEEKSVVKRKMKEEKEKLKNEQEQKKKAKKEGKEMKQEQDKIKLEEKLKLMQQNENLKKAKQDSRRSSQQQNREELEKFKLNEALEKANEYLKKANQDEIAKATEEQEEAEIEIGKARKTKMIAEQALKDVMQVKKIAEKEMEDAKKVIEMAEQTIEQVKVDIEIAEQAVVEAIQDRRAAEQAEETAKTLIEEAEESERNALYDMEKALQAQTEAQTEYDEAEKAVSKADIEMLKAEEAEIRALQNKVTLEMLEKTAIKAQISAESAKIVAKDDSEREQAELIKLEAQENEKKAKAKMTEAENLLLDAKNRKANATQGLEDAITWRETTLEIWNKAYEDLENAKEALQSAREEIDLGKTTLLEAEASKKATEEEEQNARSTMEAAQQAENDAQLRKDAAEEAIKKAIKEKEAAEEEERIYGNLEFDD